MQISGILALVLRNCQAQLFNVLVHIFWLEPESQHSEAVSPKYPVFWAHICLHFALLRDSWPALTHRKAHLATFETHDKVIICDKGAIILPSCRKEHRVFLRDHPRPHALLGAREMWAQQVKSWWKSWTALHRSLDSLRRTAHSSLCNFLRDISQGKKITLSIKDLILEFLLHLQHSQKTPIWTCLYLQGVWVSSHEK